MASRFCVVAIAVAMGGFVSIEAGAQAPAAQAREAVRTFPPMPQAENPVWNTTENAQTRKTASLAWTLFKKAWEQGDWAPFLAITTDDFQFYFPQGVFAGLHEGRAGKERLVTWANYHRQAGNRLRAFATHVTIAGNIAVFEAASESIPQGAYRNYEAVIFEVRGDRVSALREYWNVLEPGTDPSGN